MLITIKSILRVAGQIPTHEATMVPLTSVEHPAAIDSAAACE